MRIDILCNDGSPMGVTPGMMYGESPVSGRVGVGGSEYALLTMCEYLAKAGHEVNLYNDPVDSTCRIPHDYGFDQWQCLNFDPNANRDVLIIFRSPNAKSINAKGLKVWWSCDQFTVGNFAEFYTTVHKTVCISQFHADYFGNRYGINDAIVTDLPVRLDEYQTPVEKVRNRFIFNSVPNRGVIPLKRIWPTIRMNFPDASLIITSDYRLWGASHGTEEYRVSWMDHGGYEYAGALPRRRMVEEQLKAEFCLYPCTYDELFCIAAAENQVAGIELVTTSQGALRTTNMDVQLDVDAKSPHNDMLLADAILKKMRERKFDGTIQQKAIERFDPMKIVRYWEERILQ